MTAAVARGGVALWALLSAAPTWPLTPEERGDAAFRQRAAGFAEGGIPDPRPIAAAVAAYEEALAGDPENLSLRCKLMDALYFQGYHAVAGKKEKRKIFDRLLAVSRRTLELVEDRTGRREILPELSPEERAEVLRSVPEAAEAHFWLAASWGLWGMTHHPLAAVRKGVVHKVRDHARMVILIDEGFDDGAGLRILGRLHTATPRVPLLTDWIDRTAGLSLLRRAFDVSPREPQNLLFLAEAILKYERENRARAVELLRELDRRSPRPEEQVEESKVLARARELLAKIEGRA